MSKKMKTHKGAKKRFKVTGSGKVVRRSKNLNHFLEKKSSRRKRRLRGESEVAAADRPRIEQLLSS
jgi:large subunit ribosomal protein L35